MDVVYVVKTDPENDTEELRYSLRSLNNLPHRNVFMIGEKPDWVRNVEFIAVPQDGSKYRNVRTNVLTAIENENISDDFILMNDDFFIMDTMQAIPPLNYGDMKQLIEKYEDRYPEGSTYITAMNNTYELLKQRGIKSPTSYELHVPMVINRSKARQLLGGAVDPSIHFRSMYGNTFDVGGKTVNDVKMFIDPTHNHPDYNDDPEAYMRKQSFLSVTGGAFKRGIPGSFVRTVFSTPSIYES